MTNKDIGWVVFVNKAVYRFFAWTSATWNKTSSVLSETDIPPLDVIMVWHTYLLNPRIFYEDSRRMINAYATNLIAIEEMPLTLISSLIDPETLDPLPPSDERLASFEQTSKTPYHFSLITDRSETLTLDCPFCAYTNQLVRWVNDDEKGFAQTKFEHKCEKCVLNFTKSNIGVRRFCEEVTRRRKGEQVFISETLLNPATGLVDTTTATATIEKLFRYYLEAHYQVFQPLYLANFDTEVARLATALQYDYLQISDALHRGLRPNETPNRSKPIPRIQRISVAYSHAGLASTDLVGAVLRQGTFVQKMFDLGWTRPGRFDLVKESAPLVRSIARYHAFLDLMAHHPPAFFVPTLDLDLAWHTHQLKAQHYRDDTVRILERFPNHDDSVDALHLSKGYDITAKAWKLRFGVPYSVCGCTPDRECESRLSRFVSRITSIGSSIGVGVGGSGSSSGGGHQRSKSASSSVERNEGLHVLNSRPDLVSTEEDEADSSHPSEHNLLFGDPDDPKALGKGKLREKKSVKCAANAKKAASRDPWRGLQAERNEQRKKEGHKEAFTDPHYGYGAYYPYWGVSAAVPVGFYGGYGIGAVGACGAGCGNPGCSGGGGGGGGGGGCSGGATGCGGCGGGSGGGSGGG
ncbi:hypothetical protein FRC17_004468 [Serendipita sp. 399]|nr:hypothetical protein FRC17_004468 [Serendipita sp. 399]